MYVRLRKCASRLLLFGLLALAAIFMLLKTWPDGGGWRSSEILEGNNLRYGIDSQYNDPPSDLPLKIIQIGMDKDKEKDHWNERGRKELQELGSCKIPTLEKDRPEIMKFIKKLPPLDCAKKNGEDWLRIDEDNKIQLTPYAKKNVAVSKLDCSWQFFDRKSDSKLTFAEKQKFLVGAKVEQGDFFEVHCQDEAKKWKGLFMTVAPKKELIAKLEKKKHEEDWSGLNVYIISFDSLSQMAFRRSLPKSVEYLENVMQTAVFNGYNIVGDGTPQAFIPFLTGQTEEELPLTRKRFASAKFVDDVYPFAWNNFSQAGYATLYGEDNHSVGTYTYRLKGFRNAPTDHYPLTFFHRLEQNCGTCFCVGGTPQHKMWFRYMESFWKGYKEVPKFMLMHHSLLSHDDINKVQLADEDLRDHLKKQFESGAFNNTLVIVMADHGHRFAGLRETHQGQLEERLPFFSTFLPHNLRNDPRFKVAFENLKQNAQDRLASHFDMHATLLDLLKWPTPLKLTKPHQPDSNRSLSLFRPIPLNRTCTQAGIEPHWCTCLSWQPAMGQPPNNAQEKIEGENLKQIKTSRQLARAVVQVMNDQTQQERKLCAKLALHKLVDAKKLVPNDNLLKYTGILDKDGFSPKLTGNVKTAKATYQLVFVTVPGNAKYEATVLYDTNFLSQTVTVDLTAISHITPYGDTPHCVIDKNYFLAAYCVCYDKIR